MTIKGVLFDLDDTLYDSTSFVDRARREAIKMMIDAGLNATEEEAYNILQRIIKEKGSNYGHHFDDLVKAIEGQYNPKIVTMGVITYHNVKFALLRPYPDTIKTLIELKKIGLKLGVITDGITIKQWEKLIRLGIADFFDDVVTSEEYGLGKPNIEFYRYALKKMNLKGEEVVYVGDRIDKDIIPASKVGMHTIRILRGKYSYMEGECEYEVKCLREVVDIVKRLIDGVE
ncbi:MAG TPA: TIGR02253 family HAD-type hydrolase [Methanothermococcus okinawensis]|uniref:Glyceraldehyde 3-phosphate phosphatase n=1 Tax=Methanothermococcus okinawensis TaxID=155863 RepID=A0A832ZLL4_9EURY|nr:TIGR02253 family HAD-type hydrolase [Methanococcaceae archaeon]HIP84661.1 TIGR02253 family HAD-type hydrolase [Methanothermococcus okinawensis]HIP91721.1 TIGR02253 family HAD-type hydrolase [Methanothermococcus okinawensis]